MSASGRRRAGEQGLVGELEAGLRLGRFRVLEVIGEGGMGAILGAIDEVSGQEVAIKLMRGGGGDERRFEREIDVLASLDHPRIVRYREQGSTADGRRFLVMERLRGEDLRGRLARASPTIDEWLALAIGALEGLDAAHSRGVIHRDLKPSNIFLIGGEMRAPKLIDFGLALTGEGAQTATKGGVIVGTIGYMAPEQARGERAIDPRTDLFSLGCVLYEALAGRPPFAGASVAAILSKILIEQPTPLGALRPDLPAALAQVVEAMLAKRPELRPGSARAVIEALARWEATSQIERPRSASPVISYREQQALCVLMTAPSEPAAGAVARSAAQADVELGGERMALLDGSEVRVFAADGPLHEVVAAAARWALWSQRAEPGRSQALAIGGVERLGEAVVGRVIDAAASLLQGAAAGAIVVDETAARLLRGAFELSAESPQRLLWERVGAPRSELLLGRASPFVGRSRELEALRGLYEQCVEERRCCAALVVGAPGLGKSRLCEELLAVARDSGVAALELRCSPTLERSPLGALRAALRGTAGILAADPPPQARAKALARFGEPAPEVHARASARGLLMAELCGCGRVDAEAAARSGPERDPSVIADGLRVAWLDWLRAEARRGPLLLVVEDLHCCDAMSAEFVAAAARDLAELPLMVLALARPEVRGRFPPPWPIAAAELLELSPISRRAGEQLVQRALGPLAPAAALASRAEGNPFFLVELIRAAAVDAEAPSTLPDTILPAIQARLWRLSEAQRRLLRAVSVFDGDVELEAVARLLGGSIAEARRLAATLVEAELLCGAGDEGERLRFRHALVGEAAYTTLVEEDRAAAHLAAAQWLAAAWSDEPAVIAAHYARGGERAAAAAWYARAARRALACSDLREAADHTARAHALGVADEGLVIVRIVEAELALWRGEPSVAGTLARAASSAVSAGGELWFTALRLQIACAEEAVDEGALRGLIEQIRPYSSSSSAYALCVASAGYALCVRGALEEASALIQPLLALVDSEALAPLARAALLRVRSVLAASGGELWASLVLLGRASGLFEEAGELRAACRLRATIAYMLTCLGASARAAAMLEEASVTARRIGADEVALYLVSVAGFIALHSGARARAFAIFEAHHEAAAARGIQRLRFYLRVGQARSAEDSAAALRWAREALGLAGEGSSGGLMAAAAIVDALLRRGQFAEAGELAARGLVGLSARRTTADDTFWVWSRFVEALALSGAEAAADAATVEALARVRGLHAEIDDEALRAALLSYRPVEALAARARARRLDA